MVVLLVPPFTLAIRLLHADDSPESCRQYDGILSSCNLEIRITGTQDWLCVS
jgi:hypothetical protein